jgi:hypothetical protein
MITLRFGASSLLVAVAAAAFVTVSTHDASAMPMRPFVLATGAGIVSVACKQGNPNCTPVNARTPQRCGGPGNPCVIDGGPECQNASSCGTDNTGNHNLNSAGNMPGVVNVTKKPKGGGNAARPVGGGTAKAN